MNSKYTIIIAIVAIAIIIGSVAAYIYLSQPSTSSIINNLAGRWSNIPVSTS